jgi:rare lipoprotein A
VKRQLLLLIAFALLITGCAKKRRVVPAPPHASWYGHPYHGRPSSSGEIYDMEKLTAAHRTLPFGTVVEVRNLANGRTVQVRINDRGPFVDGRIIDLSRAAAVAIGMWGAGTAKVRIRVVALPGTVAEGYFAVQVGAFRERANADRQRKLMERRYGSARLVLRDGDPPLWRVLVGREPTVEGADALAGRVRNESGPAFVVRVEASGSNL